MIQLKLNTHIDEFVYQIFCMKFTDVVPIILEGFNEDVWRQPIIIECKKLKNNNIQLKHYIPRQSPKARSMWRSVCGLRATFSGSPTIITKTLKLLRLYGSYV